MRGGLEGAQRGAFTATLLRPPPYRGPNLPRRMKYIKSRKQRAERNATAVTFSAPPPRAHLRAALAAAGGARGRRGAAGPRSRPAGVRHGRCAFLSPGTSGGQGAGSRGTRLGRPLGCARPALPPSPPDISKEYFGIFEN